MNTVAKNELEKDFLKTMGNIRNDKDMKLVTSERNMPNM